MEAQAGQAGLVKSSSEVQDSAAGAGRTATVAFPDSEKVEVSTP